MKTITVLGATGSIGTQTLDVVRKNRKDFHIAALTGGSNVKKMAELVIEFQPDYVVMKDEEKIKELEYLIPGEECQMLCGMEGLLRVSKLRGVNTVVAAMVGMIGLRPVIEAIRSGKDIALANKETPLAKRHKVRILPVDSEHSAIFQSLHGEKRSQIETIFLTASGGPFRSYSREELEQVTVEQALAHPNWLMGPKITVDSATMINKGLEIIEAKWLFGVPLSKIHVVVQPQSIIHSMVGFRDGAVMAQLGTPDMRLPIQYALYYPKRVFLDGERLDFEQIAEIHFEKPNTGVLRGIPLAMEASRIGGTMPTVMNAANEYAVAKFLNKEIKFLQIYDMIEHAMKYHNRVGNPSLSEILEAEKETYARLDAEWRII